MQDKLCQHAALYTVNDWVRGQQQFCLTRERICCPKPHAEGNISVLGSNKTAELSEKPVYRCFVIHHYFFQHFPLTIFASQGFLIRTASQKNGADQKPLASEDVHSLIHMMSSITSSVKSENLEDALSISRDLWNQ